MQGKVWEIQKRENSVLRASHKERRQAIQLKNLGSGRMYMESLE